MLKPRALPHFVDSHHVHFMFSVPQRDCLQQQLLYISPLTVPSIHEENCGLEKSSLSQQHLLTQHNLLFFFFFKPCIQSFIFQKRCWWWFIHTQEITIIHWAEMDSFPPLLGSCLISRKFTLLSLPSNSGSVAVYLHWKESSVWWEKVLNTPCFFDITTLPVCWNSGIKPGP